MTSNNLHNKIRTRILLALVIIGLLFTSMFFFTACADDTTSDNPNYTYTDQDDALISNPNFYYGTADTAMKNFPLTSTTGWTRSKDSTGVSASSKSGIIDVTDEGFKAAMTGLYTDSYYLDYLMNKYSFNKEDAKNALIEQNKDKTDYKPSNEEIKNYVVENFMLPNVTNPSKASVNDNKIYMLNNYTSNINWGASQKITSSNEVTVKKGEFVKVSVSVYTQNLAGLNDKFGASIRINAKYNEQSQADFVLANIKTNGWETYTLYVKGDIETDITFTLSLGLGYNIEYQTEGTAYFDNVVVEKIDQLPQTNQLVKQFTYGNDDAIIVDTSSTSFDKNSNVIYDLTMSKVAGYNVDIEPTFDCDFTVSSNDTTSQDKNWTSSASNTLANKELLVELTNASYSINISSSDFIVEPESYARISFLLSNELTKFGSTSITLDVIETTNGLNKKTPAVATITDTNKEGEFSRYSVVIKNNFDEIEFAGANRTFVLVLVIGPTKISETDNITDYATGKVTLKDFDIAKGKTYQFDKDNKETENFELYELYTSIASGSTSLYAGYSSDYLPSSEESSAEGFEVSAVDLGYIKTRPVVAKNFDGVVPKHIYIVNDNTASSTVNERTSLYGKDGSYAGVVNSNNDYYSYTKDAQEQPVKGDKLVGVDALEDNIQALMIYNKPTGDDTVNNYGYISMDSTKFVSANTYAKVSVKVKVLDSAKAFIYLVDTNEKEVLSFVDFTPNTNGISAIPSADRTAVNGKDNRYALEIDSQDMQNAVDGWLTVEFYIATGKESKSFRIELWNGDRNGTQKSEGYVFFKDVVFETALNSFEPESFTASFVGNDNPLAVAGKNSFSNGYLCYIRELTDIEKEFNQEYPEKTISYKAKIVWAKNDTMVYGVFNNLEVYENDPYDSIVEDDTTEETGCATETDPATFWLSFSSILLAVVLLAAIIMLFVRNSIRRNKANASDAKSHYTVKSRVRYSKSNTNDNENDDNFDEEESFEETIEEVVEEVEEQTEETVSDDIYGEIEYFDNDKKPE